MLAPPLFALLVLAACRNPTTEVGYLDRDGDGFGSTPSWATAGPPARLSAVAGDCDDEDPSRHPDAAETCDGLDNNCDGSVDEGLPTQPWTRDDDGDGYGVAGMVWSFCGPYAGFAALSGDCDDQDPQIHPGANEPCWVDRDCDGQPRSCQGAWALDRPVVDEGQGPAQFAIGDLRQDDRHDLLIGRERLRLSENGAVASRDWEGRSGWVAPGLSAEGAVLWADQGTVALVEGASVRAVAEGGPTLGFGLALNPEGAWAAGEPAAGRVVFGGGPLPAGSAAEAGLGVTVHLADLDGDGLPELLTLGQGVDCALRVVPTSSGPVTLEPGAGCWDLPSPEPDPRLASTDLDGDGRQDLLVGLPNARDGGGVVYLAQGAPVGRAVLADGPLRYEVEGARRFGAALATVPDDDLGPAALVVASDAAPEGGLWWFERAAGVADADLADLQLPTAAGGYQAVGFGRDDEGRWLAAAGPVGPVQRWRWQP